MRKMLVSQLHLTCYSNIIYQSFQLLRYISLEQTFMVLIGCILRTFFDLNLMPRLDLLSRLNYLCSCWMDLIHGFFFQIFIVSKEWILISLIIPFSTRASKRLTFLVVPLTFQRRMPPSPQNSSLSSTLVHDQISAKLKTFPWNLTCHLW